MKLFKEERTYPRYKAKADTYVRFSDDGQNKQLLDISCCGAKINGVDTESFPNDGKATFGKGDKVFEFTRHYKSVANNKSGVSFEKPLSGAQVALLAKQPNTSSCIEMAMLDRDKVKMEIRNIQDCRSRIFQGVIAIISVWIMGACGLFLTHHLAPFIALWVGGIIPFLILTISIFASIEKARAVNRRRGFLIALDEYARHGIAPPNYLGWNTLYANRSECRARAEMGLCMPNNQCCWSQNLSSLNSLTGQKHIIPKVLDSFTAFSSIVYGALYILASIVLLASTAFLVSGMKSWISIPSLLLTGSISTAIIILFWVLLKGLRKGKQTIEANYLVWKSALEKCKRVDGSDEVNNR